MKIQNNVQKIRKNVQKVRQNVQKSKKCAIEPKSPNGSFWAQKWSKKAQTWCVDGKWGRNEK